MEEDIDLTEEFKESFKKLSKSIIDPKAEKDNEFDLGIEFDEQYILQFEEEQELEQIFEDAVDRVCEGLFFIEEDEEE